MTDPARAAQAAHVSRETLDRLDGFVALLSKWNTAINLVARSTIPQIWTRHIADSAQLAGYIRDTDRSYLDLGAGAGLPGLVVAILLAEGRPECAVTLIESDTRKAAFLRTATGQLGLDATVIAARIEAVPGQGADVVSARALAALPKLLDLARPHLAPGGQCLFLKGENAEAEIRAAEALWRFQCDRIPSKTRDNAVILRLRDITLA